MADSTIERALGRPPETIAIFRALKLGDLLVAIPAVRALRQAFPKAHIALIGLPWAWEFTTRFSRYFDEFIEFPGFPGLPEQALDAGRTLHFLQKMQQRGFDLILQMQGNGTIVNPLVELMGARLSAGFYPRQLPQYCLNPDLYLPYPEQEHEIRRHVALVEFLGVPAQGFAMEFPLTSEDGRRTRDLADIGQLNDRSYVCIHPGGISARRWPESRFAQVADALADQGYRVVLTGTANEAPIVEKVKQQMKAPVVDLSGKTDLGTVGYILSRAALLVSNDTGVAHIAAALPVPSVVIYTTSDPAEWGSLNHQLHRAVREAEATDAVRVIKEAFSLLMQTRKPGTD